MDAPRTPILTFLGAAGTVTGSRFLFETGRARVLVDAGMFQGHKSLRLRNREPFPVDPNSIDAVLVTHAHVDHLGFVPALTAAGFRGPVITTPRTAELAEIVLRDAGRLQEEEAEYANRKGYSKHHPATPLYTEEDAMRALDRIAPRRVGGWSGVAPGVEAEFRHAGHILGAASIALRFDGPELRSAFVSGDVGRPHHPLLRGPDPPPAADAFLVEATYGDRQHGAGEDTIEILADAVRRTAERGGVVLIPAFAVDRTEVVLLALRRLVDEGRIPSLPVFADSPMALDVLDVYRKAIADGDEEILVSDEHGDPFDPGRLEAARTREDSIALNEITHPSIIISASGMATGGRVLHHLARRLPNPRNTVVLVGFQAAGTRGRRLVDGERAVKMLGRYVPVRAEVVVADAFSVHADADEMVAWLRRAPAPPAATFVVHGEADAADVFAARIGAELGWTAVAARDRERVVL